LEETRRKRQIEMTTVSKELETEYQAKLQAQLRDMRANFDAQIAYNRREVEEMYDGKVQSISSCFNTTPTFHVMCIF
jgi:hypothetical protein